jgi:hypothetical protein
VASDSRPKAGRPAAAAVAAATTGGRSEAAAPRMGLARPNCGLQGRGEEQWQAAVRTGPEVEADQP